MSGNDHTKYWKTKKFHSLQQFWQRKLAEAGFFDIEWHTKSLKSRKSSLSPSEINEKYLEKSHVKNHTVGETLTSGFQNHFLKNDNARIYTKLKEMSPESLYEYIQHRYTHFHAVQNFLTHVNLDDPFDKKMLEQYSEGRSYRQITKCLKNWACRHPKKQGTHYSLYWIHTRMQKLLKEIMIWNRQHPEGIFQDMHESSISDYVV